MTAQHKSVLIVEDDPDVADTLAHIVRQQDFEVTVAYDGEWAAELFGRRPFDIAFFDVMLPGMSGVDCLIAFRAKWPKASCFVMTGYASEEQAARAFANGVSDVMRKPVKPEDILAKLRRAEQKEILLVDDDPEVSQSLAAALRKAGWTCAVAPDGETALDLLRGTDFGALILDLGLPGLSGQQLCQALQQMGRAVPTLVVTGQEQDVSRLPETFIQGCLRKPVDPRVVLAMVEKMSQGAN